MVVATSAASRIGNDFERAKTLQANTPVEITDPRSMQVAQDEMRNFGFVMVDSANHEITDQRQLASALWAPVGPSGIPRPPPILEGDVVMPAVPAPGSDDGFMHASQDSYFSAGSLSFTASEHSSRVRGE